MAEQKQFPTTLTESERFFVNFDIFKLHAPLENVKGNVIETLTKPPETGGAVLLEASAALDNLN